MKNLQPRLTTLAPRLAYGDSGNVRARSQHWQGWYSSPRWRKLRWSVLVRDCFKCQRCGYTIADTSLLVCDHVEPHRGDARAFWSGPFQTLCKGCHDVAKQREEIAARPR